MQSYLLKCSAMRLVIFSQNSKYFGEVKLCWHLIPWYIRFPSPSAFNVSGYFSDSHAGGVAVGVQKTTFIFSSAVSARNSSQNEKSYFPSSGSISAHENSARRITSMPYCFMRCKSSFHSARSQCSG